MKKQPRNMIYRNYSDFRKGYNSTRSKRVVRKRKKSTAKIFGIALLIAAIFSVPTYAYFHTNSNKPSAIKSVPPKTVAQKTNSSVIASKPAPAATVTTTQTTACSNNSLSKAIITSISQRHLWACEGTQVAYQTAVITGDINVVADATPIGTYHIYDKSTSLYLNGSDSRGTWHDYVNYWMPFLSNQYGVFGIHDATWRTSSDFGNVSPYSGNSSHGCIEMPLAASQWLFNWSRVGTTITIES